MQKPQKTQCSLLITIPSYLPHLSQNVVHKQKQNTVPRCQDRLITHSGPQPQDNLVTHLVSREHNGLFWGPMETYAGVGMIWAGPRLQCLHSQPPELLALGSRGG